MEDNFNHDDFEEFLQDQVRNHRMYPADAVWREIDKKLHGEKRWPALTIAAAMLVGATVLICVYFTPKPNIFLNPTANVNTSTQPPFQQTDLLNNFTTVTPFAKEKSSSVSLLKNEEKASSKVVDAQIYHQSIEAVTAAHPSPANINTAASAPIKNIVNASASVARNSRLVVKTQQDEKAIDVSEDTKLDAESSSLTLNNIGVKANKTPLATATEKDYNDKNIVDEFLDDHKSDVQLHTSSKKISLKNKFSYQFYVAPSVSYRKLLEDNSILNDANGGPVGLNYVTDVNNVVRHKPGTGIEAGFSIMYNLSNKVRIKSGFQFNMRQYSIEAYRSSTELASIALRGSNGIDTVNTLAIYRNNNGYYSAQLVNRYYQISVPIGIEWEIIGNKLIALNVAGTIQPTYLLNRNAYLLSTNFKNYTESPGMVRQWNINSNIEAFVSMKVGDFKWQLGPQLRYQPYSTFIPEYTIKEHLMDYGLKLGVSKTLR
ncbi:MAG: hypothetical protein M3040_11875 [Bacteroidota bacterium]|nr:hypothetical protein [Bacteroidota bacterium]